MQHVGPLPNYIPLYSRSSISSGCSTVSSDEKVVVVSNLYDGLDWYKIPDRTFSRSVPIRIAKNVIIPVQFVERDTLLITGGTSGMAKVLDARTAETIQTLDHDCRVYSTPAITDILTNPTDTADDMIQAIVCHVAPPTIHAHYFRRVFTYLWRTVRGTLQQELQVEDRSYMSGFLNPLQSPQQMLGLPLSPLPLPLWRHLEIRLGFSMAFR